MFTEQGLQRDFRRKGYTSQNMVSPRLPVTQSPMNEKIENETKLVKYFGKPSIFDPAKPRIDDSQRGMMYGRDEYDRGYPHPKPLRNPNNEKSDAEMDKIRRQQVEMDEDIRMMKEKQMREKVEREEEKKQDSGNNRRRKFLETDLSPRNQPGYKSKRETDLFLDVLGGPDGKQLRENGGPGLIDQRFDRQQQQYNAGKDNLEPQLRKHEQRMDDLRQQINQLKHTSGMDEPMANNDAYSAVDFSRGPSMQEQHRRSLDLDNTRGGAGAPVRDDRGKAVTRRPITLKRNDYGDSSIKEDVPGGNIGLSHLVEDTDKPYYPWGSQGGGAPIRDREGNVKTQIYGKLEGRDMNFVGAESHRAGSGEVRRYKRRQEVLHNELKEGMRQQQENKEEITRFMKAPPGELADVIRAGRVGKPKRNEITGEIGQHHLGNSDVSKLKMNYQPKPVDEKKSYHDELVKMAEERQQLKQLEKLKEKQESNAHFNNMDGMWGMFGGGAPKDPSVRKKANLFNSIHNPDHTPTPRTYDSNLPLTGLGNFDRNPNASYRKLYLDNDDRRYASPDNSPRYVKATTNSNHKNMFDAPDNARSLVVTNNRNVAPYATGGVY